MNQLAAAPVPPARPPAGEAVVTPVSRWFYAYVYAGLLLVSGALQRPLGGDVLEGSWREGVIHNTNYAMLAVGAVYYALTALLAYRCWPRLRLPRGALPLVVLVGLAIASIAWSDSPGTVLNRWLGLAGCTLFGVLSVSILGVRRMMEALVWFFAVFFLVNFILAFAAYNYTHHSADEVLFGSHAGQLKGTYVHKTAIGVVLSLGLLPMVIFGDKVLRSRVLQGAFVAIGLYLLLKTGSAQTFVSVPVALAAGFVCARLSLPSFRTLLFLTVAIVGFYLYSTGAFETLVGSVFASVGRDSTMSGRTIIWEAALRFGMTKKWLGGGYATGWEAGAGQTVATITGSDPGHAHNGFIETFIDLGLIGLGTALVYLGWIALDLFKLRLTRTHRYYLYVVAWFVLFVLNNSVGSYMMQTSDIYWFSMVLAPFVIEAIDRSEMSVRRRFVPRPAARAVPA